MNDYADLCRRLRRFGNDAGDISKPGEIRLASDEPVDCKACDNETDKGEQAQCTSVNLRNFRNRLCPFGQDNRRCSLHGFGFADYRFCRNGQ